MDIISKFINKIMNEGSSPSTYESDGVDSDFQKNPISPKRVAIFDWDNTLYCTQYFELHIKDYKEIFEERASIESFGNFLTYELQILEEVK
jgi:hypothetical protein